MNYIKELENDRVGLLKTVVAFDEGMQRIRDYLLSSKFHDDPTVQVSDVLMRMEEVRMDASYELDAVSDRKVKK